MQAAQQKPVAPAEGFSRPCFRRCRRPAARRHPRSGKSSGRASSDAPDALGLQTSLLRHGGWGATAVSILPVTSCNSIH